MNASRSWTEATNEGEPNVTLEVAVIKHQIAEIEQKVDEAA